MYLIIAYDLMALYQRLVDYGSSRLLHPFAVLIKKTL